MPVREFWEEEPNLLWAYRKSYMEELKVKRELINFQAWLEGTYIYDAVSKSIFNNFNGKGIVKHYMERPIDFSKTVEDLEKEKRKAMEDKIKQRTQEIKKMLGK